MSKSLRLSEKWFRRGLWLVALVFAWFLIGLGSTVIKDLPRVEQDLRAEQFMDAAAAQRLREAVKGAQAAAGEARDALEQARLKARVAQADTAAARDAYSNWLATRSATGHSDRDPDLIARTAALERMRQAERAAQATVEQGEQALLDATQREAAARRDLADIEQSAQKALSAAQNRQELRVFAYRLALTLPLLALAGWLFVRQRRTRAWPFVWGFVIFAAFVFFVELVPYLPSYGGYVHYAVGIVVTVLVGRWAIGALERYLERQRQAEALPDAQRRGSLAYDTALARLAKGVCPGCERPVDLKNEAIDFCPHCGIGLHDHCAGCNARKSAFARFCHACGRAAATGQQPA